MRALLQRTTGARVVVDGEAAGAVETIGAIGAGLVILLGVGPDDAEETADDLARKVAELRIFRDDDGRTNRSLLDIGGAALVVSQFTLYADTRRGLGLTVATGRFGSEMAVELVNDGPFTIWLDTDDR